jgi:hypothetical protein
VPFSYASNVKANSGSLRNLPFKVEACTSPIFLGSICDLSRNISVVPNPQFPLNTALLTTFTFRDPLDSSSLHPTCRHFTCPMSPVFVHSMLETITFLIVVSDSKISVASVTLALI